MAAGRPKREGVQLAYPLDEGRLSRLGPVFLGQPKYRGERCRTEWFQGQPVLLSSYNNILPHLEHIKEAIKLTAKELKVQIPFDGELYVHGWTQEQIGSAVHCEVNYNPDNALLEYHVFDIATAGVPQQQRLMYLNINSEVWEGSPIKTAEIYSMNKDNWMDACNDFIDRGYEGIVLRALQPDYTPKKTTAMLKFKPTETDEYRIEAVLEAISQEGKLKGMVGAFMVSDADGHYFKVGAGKLTHPERVYYWNHRNSLIGGMLTVKHEYLRTTNNVPVCAVAVGVGRMV